MKELFSYIHIPFCELKCNYCRFASIWSSQKVKIDFYVKNLLNEIKKSSFKKGILNSIYFGWWTPSVLEKNHLENIILELKSKYYFSENIEITLESTPNNVTQQNLDIWNNIWINRLSIWIQTLNEKSLKEINRWNKWDINLCLENLKKYSKIKNISLDFIIWLPHVQSWEILENIKFVLDKYDFVKHISVYMLEEYYNPDKIIETKYDNITYPDDWNKLWISDEEYLGEYSNIKKYLINSWFINYEISNFWKLSLHTSPEGEEVEKYNFECKHNQAYWNHWEIYAFWLWAWWLIEKNWDYYRYLNSDNFKKYYSWEKIFEDKLSASDIFLEKLLFQARTSWIEKSIYEKLDTEKIDYYIKNWYLKKELSRDGWSPLLKLTDSWILIMDYILSEIV